MQEWTWNPESSVGWSVNLQDKSSALVVLPLVLRPDRPALTFRDFASEGLPGMAGTLVTRPRPGTHSKRSWQPIKHTSSRPEEQHFSVIISVLRRCSPFGVQKEMTKWWSEYNGISEQKPVREAGLKREEALDCFFDKLWEGRVPSASSSLMAVCLGWSVGSSLKRLSSERRSKSNFWDDSCIRAWACATHSTTKSRNIKSAFWPGSALNFTDSTDLTI